MGFTTTNHIEYDNANFSYSNDYQDYNHTPVVMSVNNFNTLDKNSYNENSGPNVCDEIWNVSVTWSFTGVSVTCETGGSYACKDEGCEDVSGGPKRSAG